MQTQHSPTVRPRKKAALLRVVSSLLFVLMMASSALAQTFTGLSGTVQDSSKASVKGAKVTVTSLETGNKRVATTSSAGFYSFPDLLVGHYSIRVESSGFQSELNPGVKLDGSVSATVNFALKPGDVSTTVDVEAIGVELDRTSSAIGNTFNLQQLSDLPINSRSYVAFALLNTGVTFRSTSQNDVTFDGVGQLGNNYYIDGVEATQISAPYIPYGVGRGERLANGSQESIAEFRVLSNGYSAEYGRADGGVVNMVTKAGTNRYHGEAFDYFRNEALDARNFFATPAKYPSKPRFRYNDFGGNLNGPIWKDKTFLFANYEGDRQQLGLIASGTVLSSTARAQAIAAYPALAPLVAAEPVGIDISPTSQVANYSTSGNLSVAENDTSVRLDHNFSQKDSMFARYTYNQSLVSGPDYSTAGSTAFGVNQVQNDPTAVTNIAVHEQHIFSPRLINDALAGFQRYFNDTNQAYPLPRVTIGGLAENIGNLGNIYSINNGFQYGDAMTLVLNKHTLKFGSTFYRIQMHTKSIPSATISYANINAFIANSISSVSLSTGDPGHNTLASEISSYAQDSWQARPNLSINYGVRWDVATTPHDKFYATQAYNPQTGTLFAPGHEYYPIDFATFGPRLGVAYSPTPRMVIRAGSGLYFQNPLPSTSTGIYANTLQGNGTLTQAGNPGLSYPYTSYANASAAILSPVGFDSPHQGDFTAQYNFSVAEEIRPGFFAQLAYVGVHGFDLQRPEDFNLYPKGGTVRPNPNFGDIYVFENNGELSYNSLQASLKGKIKQLTLDLHYTWAHAIDDDGDSGGTYAQDINNLHAERGNGAQDQRENFNYTLTYDLPMGAGHGFLGSSVAPVRVLASGWSVNSIGIFTTGTPINVVQTLNTYGNSNFNNQRPNLVAGVPRYLPTTMDTNGNIKFLNIAAWTTPAAGTFGNSPRNVVTGPHFTDVDFALKKSTQIHDNQRLDFRAELFNVFNHPNFGPPSTTFVPGSTTFGEISSTLGSTIGFGTSRQIQFALKYSF